MNALVILDDPGMGTGRATHGMDLALELARSEGIAVRVYLLGAAVELACIPRTARGGKDAGRQVSRLVSGGVEVAVNEGELRARGLGVEDLVLGAQPASGPILAAWTLDADRVLVF